MTAPTFKPYSVMTNQEKIEYNLSSVRKRIGAPEIDYTELINEKLGFPSVKTRK